MAIRSKTTLFNAALLRTGNNSVTSGSGDFIWQALEANYDEIVRSAFEDTEYPFGKARITLTGRSVGRFGYDDAYAMTSSVIHVVEVYFAERSASDLQEPWEIDAETNELMVNARGQVIEIEHLKVGLEHTWSATFARGIQLRLEAVIKDVLEETEEAQAKESEADFLLLKGGVKASKNRSGQNVWKRGASRLARARRGGRR